MLKIGSGFRQCPDSQKKRSLVKEQLSEFLGMIMDHPHQVYTVEYPLEQLPAVGRKFAERKNMGTPEE